MKRPNQEPKTSHDSNEIFSDEATRDKIHKHLSDINDVITEDDIKNAKTSLSEGPSRVDENIDPIDGEVKDNDSPSIQNDSWNVMEDRG